MLTQLLISNLAIIDKVEIELSHGMTVLTGETGAGKSILVDALGLALGERADSDAVRAGSTRAEVSAVFELEADGAAADWLTNHDLDTADTSESSCVLRRVVNSDGRSRGYINGNAVPIQTLRELGDLLVDICGQQAHQSLTRTECQRDLLDQHAGAHDCAAAVRQAWQRWHNLQADCTALERSRADRDARLELLQFQVHELEALAAQPGEATALDQAQRRAANASRLQNGAAAALQALYEGDGNDQSSAHDLVSQARDTLDTLAALEPSLGETARMLEEAEIQITEAADNLRHYLLQDKGDSSNLAELENRMAALHDCARKHRVSIDELPDLTLRLAAELAELEHADSNQEKLFAEIAATEAELDRLCQTLSEQRHAGAVSLAEKVTHRMQTLGMPEAKFHVAMHELTTAGASGRERVEFQVAINPGSSPAALAKVASGGELSRISLAIQVTASNQVQTPTLIFDEVDAGVGGGTADIVGDQLRELAQHSQVLCVTHLPQVASKGHQHLRVHKLSDGNSTRTIISTLEPAERIDELARMLGGVRITARTKAHAEEMLAAANNQRNIA